ncbi:MAG: hypothetical protein IJX53_01660 [Clostridia bacterium]|nr:hypothetical protein [Clostridia bacterium]
MKLPDLTRYAPLGYSLTLERTLYKFGLLFSGFYSLCFIDRYTRSFNNLRDWENKRYVLREGAVMPDFADLIDTAFIGFALVAAMMLCFIAVHYSYHTQGSRADYLMRRLPDRLELHRRCLTLPILAALGCAVCAFVLLLVYFAIYMLFTPQACLQPEQWYKIWRDFL